MKYCINLHFSATISKVIDVNDEDAIVDEKNIFLDEYEMTDVAESLAYCDWDAITHKD